MRVRTMIVVLAVAVVSLAPCVGSSQRGSPQTGTKQSGTPLPTSAPPPLNTNKQGSFSDRVEDTPDPGALLRSAARARMVAVERQKKMVQDTDKLVALATELKHEMDKINKDEMSLESIKKAQDIERLAHDIKNRMKGQE